MNVTVVMALVNTICKINGASILWISRLTIKAYPVLKAHDALVRSFPNLIRRQQQQLKRES